MTEHGISVAWLGETNTFAEATQQGVWRALASRPDWAAWRNKHMSDPDMFSVVYYEDRATERLVLRGNTCSYYVPLTYVQAAYEARTLPDFMAGLYRDVYAKWADKRGFPAPPDVDAPAGGWRTAAASRLP